MLMKTTRPNAAQVAAAVNKSAEYEAIEKLVADLKAKREERAGVLKAIYAEGAIDKNAARINALSKEIAAIESEMREPRGRLLVLREDHGRRVAEALAPLRSEIAAKLLALLDEIEPEGRALDETTVLIERAGHVDQRQRVALPWLATLRGQLNALVPQ